MDDFNAFTTAIVNSGVSIVVIAYFMFRDFKFLSTLVTTLQTLVDTVSTLKDVIAQRD